MSTRWTAPGGWTVESVTLSVTPHPSRPGDPRQHMGPHEYLKVQHLGRQVAYCYDLDELKDLAAYGLPVTELEEVPMASLEERAEIELHILRNLTIQHVAEHRCTFGDECPGRGVLIDAVRGLQAVIAAAKTTKPRKPQEVSKE